MIITIRKKKLKYDPTTKNFNLHKRNSTIIFKFGCLCLPNKSIYILGNNWKYQYTHHPARKCFSDILSTLPHKPGLWQLTFSWFLVWPWTSFSSDPSPNVFPYSFPVKQSFCQICIVQTSSSLVSNSYYYYPPYSTLFGVPASDPAALRHLQLHSTHLSAAYSTLTLHTLKHTWVWRWWFFE